MNNPFLSLETRLTNIESLLLDLKHQSKPEPTTTPDFYLTRREVSEKLRLTLTTIDKYTKLGYLKAYRIGGQIRYKANEVEKSLQEIKNLKYQR